MMTAIRRPLTWVVLGFNLLMLVLVLGGIGYAAYKSGGGSANAEIEQAALNDCVSQYGADYYKGYPECVQDHENAYKAQHGAAWAVVGLWGFWVSADIILGVVWMVTNQAPAGRPAPAM